MKTKSIILIGAISILTTGCATSLSPRASAIMDADDKMIVNCKFIGSVSGTSGFGNLAASTGINNAKNEAKEQAEKINATHVVWLSTAGGFSPAVSGNAYKCK